MDKKALHSIWFGNEITKVAGAKALAKLEAQVVSAIAKWAK